MRTLVFILLVCISARCLADPPRPGVPADRIARLAMGINLSHWFWLPAEKDAAKRADFISDAELQALTAAGFTCARFPVQPDFLWDAAQHKPRSENLAAYRAAAGRVVAAGLAVVIDPHPIDLAWAAPDDSGRAHEYEAFWTALAGALSDTDPTVFFLEVMNEPHGIKDKSLWPRAQASLVKIIREKAPHHTIIVTGDDYGGIEGLQRLKPLDDANLVYSLHFYEPHIFTHQGASWGWEGWKDIRGLQYPAEPANCQEVAFKVAHEAGRGAVKQYARDRYGKDTLQEKLATAAKWGRDHAVPVWCGEMGVYSQFAPRESRLAWLSDVAGILREHKIGWAMWDYCGGFALAVGQPGGRRLDEGVVAALTK